MSFRVTALVPLLAVCWSASVVCAADYAFDVTSGDWNVSTNWDPNGVPGVNDKAVIGNLTTCTIGSADQSAKELVVAGTLVVDGRKLTTTTAGGSASVISDGKIHLKGTSPQWEIAVPLTLNGTLHFDGTDALLKISSTLTINGSGTIDGRKAQATDENYERGTIQIVENGGVLTVDSGVTARGSLDIAGPAGLLNGAVFRNDGAVVVDASADRFQIGGPSPVGGSINFYGTGIYIVSDGVVYFYKGDHLGGEQGTSHTWYLSGGAIEIGIYTNFFGTTDTWQISGGVLKLIERALCTSGTIDWTGGKIDTSATTNCAKFGATTGCGDVNPYTPPTCP